MTKIELSEKFKSQLTKLKAEEIRERVEDVLKDHFRKLKPNSYRACSF
ncbi:hypothetical protein C5S31_02655 [ANME-1 cluster archaeon GoMg2]|nr:hypothetical protein [ANME-1 cluster archaeon GoMg2]